MHTIRRTAEYVNRWCLENRYHLNHRGYDANLTGMCAIASAKLFDMLEQLGYTPTIAVAETDNDASHVFVIVDDYIVDCTSSQFGMADVEIVHSKEAIDWFWQVYYEFDSIKALLKHQKRNGWPSYQLATPERVFYNDNNLH